MQSTRRGVATTYQLHNRRVQAIVVQLFKLIEQSDLHD